MKKFLPIFLIVILLGNLIIVKPERASANPGFRVVGSLAEKAFISISEKAGAKYATEKASEKAMKRWNMELYEDLAKQTNLNNVNETIKRAEIIPFPETDSRYGKFGKIMIGGALFLTGADIAVDVYEHIKNAEDEKKMLDLLENEVLPEHSYKSVYGYRMIPKSEPTTSSFDIVDPAGNRVAEAVTFSVYYAKPNALKVRKISDGYRLVAMGYWYYATGSDDPWSIVGGHGIPQVLWDDLVASDNPTISEEVPSGWTAPGDFPDYIREYSSPDTSPERKEEIVREVEHAFPEGVPIVVPIKETAPGEPLEIDDKEYEEVPYQWNDPLPDNLPESPTEPGTDPGTETPTEPGDGGGDGTPTTPGDGDKKIDFTPLMVALGNIKDKFPFSIPWDFERFLNQFNIEPKTPKFEIETDKSIELGGFSIPVKYNFDVDFDFLDGLAKVSRWFLLIVFDIFLIFALRRMTPD